jgi:hypothetical protein
MASTSGMFSNLLSPLWRPLSTISVCAVVQGNTPPQQQKSQRQPRLQQVRQRSSWPALYVMHYIASLGPVSTAAFAMHAARHPVGSGCASPNHT